VSERLAREQDQRDRADVAAAKAREVLRRSKEGPKPFEVSVTRVADYNHPNLVVEALLQGMEVTIDGRPTRLADSLELLVGVPKIQMDNTMKVEWVPFSCTLQGFFLLCKSMSDAEAVEAACAARF
jgi:hypothetical protein